ncbi:outer membrane usher protein [Serratia fonticola]|uniref:outer membrane usher protein n=1 Tax=Serratia fonticola TaxID=47917 RepID=UPI00217C8427|nr:outer membrane usher protein [Serratia fonticola]CAI1012395.1 Outer membrane usher protein papC precursor [Serratia fonticola]CAI1013444.1 Outer membrane usher protein papC precursor [Serratia fonticola]
MVRYFSRSLLAILCQASLGSGVLLGAVSVTQAKDIQFNTDVLDLKDRDNIDLGQFSHQGFILPGTYDLALSLNNQVQPARPVTFLAPDDDPKGSQVCLSKEMVDQLGLTKATLAGLTWWHQEQCLNLASVDGLQARTDLGTNTLYLSIPQAYLEYSSANWDPPSSWEEGIPGVLLDYNLNTQVQRQIQDSTQNYNLSGNGVAGANLGPWRLRASWQTRIDHQSDSVTKNTRSFDWTQYTAYRAITPLRAKLTLGEDFLNSDIFDSFRFTGGSLVSDDNMLPPNLRGYAPEVTGVARGNAKVVISQQGRVIKEVLVASGPFRIQDLDSAVSGALDVRVEEADGSVQRFQVDTATIPYLTRPGQVRFKLAAGRPSDWQHKVNGPMFATGEFSWGVSNGWSLYGGGLSGDDYTALSMGIGRDLMALGALSADMTQSRARLAQDTQQGGSYRLSYSKRFDETGSQVTFAGYRFSDSGFLSMADYLSAKDNPDGSALGRSKEMYTVSFSQQIESLAMSGYLNYNHQTYWNQATSDRYDLTLARYFDLGSFRNVNLSLTAYRNNFSNTKDDGMYLSLSLPWGNSGAVSYSGSYAAGSNSNSVSYSDRIGESDNYTLRTGMSNHDADMSGYYTHRGTLAQVDGMASYRSGQYSSAGVSMSGGATLTGEGGALHRTSLMGGTRMLVDTDGVAGVPVGGYGNTVNSNIFGKAVVADVNSYYRSSVRIDVDKLADNAQATGSVLQGTLTEGAIGYRHFEVVAGEKAMAVIRLADGSVPPFGATVLNAKQQETGMVNDAGNVYLSGIKPGETMTVHWNSAEQCRITLPKEIPAGMTANLLLPCVNG